MIRLIKTLATLVVLAALVPTAALAGPLFPMQVGGYHLYNGTDGGGHTWQNKMHVVAQNITINGQTYFHVRNNNHNPYSGGNTDPKDFLFRSTDTQGIVFTPGGEVVQFQTGQVGYTWSYTLDGSLTQKTITGIEPVTVPYGGPYQAYVNRAITTEPDETQLPPDDAYLVPNLGLVKEVDQAVDNPPLTLVLSEIGLDPVSLFPLKSGLRLTYNANDVKGNTWQTTMQVMEQVNLGGQNYFHVRQTNFDPYDPNGGENLSDDFYVRSTAGQVFSYNGAGGEDLLYQAAGPGTTWEADEKTKVITNISQLEVLGGLYLAYVTQQNEGDSPPMFEFVVPGKGVVQMIDYWTNPADRAPLTFTLVKVEQAAVGFSQAMNLLLLQ